MNISSAGTLDPQAGGQTCAGSRAVMFFIICFASPSELPWLGAERLLCEWVRAVGLELHPWEWWEQGSAWGQQWPVGLAQSLAQDLMWSCWVRRRGWVLISKGEWE